MREGVGTDIEISLRQPARNPQRLLGLAELLVRFLQDLKRLIIIRLCLSDDLKHLDRLKDLATLLF